MKKNDLSICLKPVALLVVLTIQSMFGVAQNMKYTLLSEYNRSTGLTFTLINQTCMSPEGLLWIATNQGLYKFDGKNFKNVPVHFSGIGTKPFISNFGRIGNDLFAVFSKETNLLFKLHYGRSDSGKAFQNYITAYRQFGLFETSQVSKSLLFAGASYPLINGTKETGYYIQNYNGEIYFGKANEFNKISTSIYYNRTSTFFNGMYYTIEVINNLSYLVGFKNGKLIVKKSLLGIFNVNEKMDLKIYSSNDKLYLYANRGIYEISNSDSNDYRVERIIQLPENFVVSEIQFSKVDESVIVISKTQGILVYGISRYTVIYSKTQELLDYPINIVYAFQPLASNTFLTTRGILGLNKSIVNISKYSDSRNIPRSKKGRILVVREDQFFVSDSALNLLFRLAPEKLNDVYPSAYACSEQNIYLYKFNSLFVYDQDFRFIRIIPLNIDQLVGFMYYFNGNLIICGLTNTYNYNLKTNKLTAIKALRSLQIDNITSIQGFIIYFVHENGWGFFKENKFLKLPLDQNKYLLTAHTAIEDDYGNIWISSNNGLFKIKKTDLLLHLTSGKPFQIAGPYLVNVEFNGNCTPAALKLKNLLIFPSLSGLY